MIRAMFMASLVTANKFTGVIHHQARLYYSAKSAEEAMGMALKDLKAEKKIEDGWSSYDVIVMDVTAEIRQRSCDADPMAGAVGGNGGGP